MIMQGRHHRQFSKTVLRSQRITVVVVAVLAVSTVVLVMALLPFAGVVLGADAVVLSAFAVVVVLALLVAAAVAAVEWNTSYLTRQTGRALEACVSPAE